MKLMFGDELDALSWLFDTKVVAKIFSHIIDIRGAGAALREIQELASAPNASAVSIATKWEEFQHAWGRRSSMNC